MKTARLERSIEEIRLNMLQGAASSFKYHGNNYWIERVGNGNFCIATANEASRRQYFYSLSDLFNYGRLEGKDILSVFEEIEFDLGGMAIRDKYAEDMLAYKQVKMREAVKLINEKKAIILKYEKQKFLIAKNSVKDYSVIQLLPTDNYKRTDFVKLSNLFRMLITSEKSFSDIWDNLIIEEVFSNELENDAPVISESWKSIFKHLEKLKKFISEKTSNNRSRKFE
ncbi:MAG: hypothetical protein ACRC6X_05075 [Culicoidibacterales bacterium]